MADLVTKMTAGLVELLELGLTLHDGDHAQAVAYAKARTCAGPKVWAIALEAIAPAAVEGDGMSRPLTPAELAARAERVAALIWRPTPRALTRAELARLAKPTRWHWWEGPSTWATTEHGQPFITHRRFHVELGGQTHWSKVRAELGAAADVTCHRPHVPGFRKSYTWKQDPQAGRRFATLRELIDAVLDHHRPDLTTNPKESR